MKSAPRGRLRAAQREQTRERIVDAAIDAFAARGYARTTVDEIAEIAGTTRATFYLHFKSKADVLPELVARSAGHFDHLYQQLAVVSTEADVETVQCWIESAMRSWADVADTARPLLEAGMVEVALREHFDHPAAAQTRLLAEALMRSAHVASPDKAFILATVLLAPLNHYFRLFLLGMEFDRTEVTDVLARSWVAILSATQ